MSTWSLGTPSEGSSTGAQDRFRTLAMARIDATVTQKSNSFFSLLDRSCQRGRGARARCHHVRGWRSTWPHAVIIQECSQQGARGPAEGGKGPERAVKCHHALVVIRCQAENLPQRLPLLVLASSLFTSRRVPALVSRFSLRSAAARPPPRQTALRHQTWPPHLRPPEGLRSGPCSTSAHSRPSKAASASTSCVVYSAS